MLILVSGLPGSGKSYFASRLSRTLDATYISSDKTRKAMGAMGHYEFEDKLKVYEQMAAIAGQNLREGKAVVVDATFYRHEMREMFRTLATLLHTPFCYFEITADEALIRKRLNEPRADSEAGYAVYQQLRQQYEPPAKPHVVLQSTDEDIDDMLERALTHIARMNERKAD